MSFIEEIYDSFKQTNADNRFVVIGMNCAYFEGVKSIDKLTNSLIILQMKKQKLGIEGTNLTIKKYCSGDVSIKGQIAKVALI